MAEPATEVRWALRPLIDLSWHDWAGEGSVAFDNLSGQIVECDVLGAALMACLESAPASVAELADSLASDLGQSPDDEFRAAVATNVEQFRLLGWVDPIIA